jgi:hypothetical protein
MEVTTMVTRGIPARHYTMPLTTDNQGEHMQNRTEIQQIVIRRAEELATHEGFQGPGRFKPRHYRLALSELSPAEREAERGLTPRQNDSQSSLAGKHFAEQVRLFTQRGLPHDLAIEFAKASEGEALRARRAGTATGPSEGAKHFGLFFRGAASSRAYSGSTTVDRDKADTLHDVVVKRIAADCLARDLADLDQTHASWADSWYGVVNPAPAPGATEVVLAAYNREREAAVNAVLEAARAILRDPEQTAKLRPTTLR